MTSDIVVWIENGYEGRYCSCGTVYTSPLPEPGSIDCTHDGHPSCFYSAYADFKARWVKKVKPFGQLLEIGCGEGHFLRAAKAAGFQVTGVDADSERAAAVSRSLGVKVRCGVFEELQFTHAYDVVYHCDLLSHFPDPVNALRKMCSILTPTGVLAFEVGTLAEVHPVWYRWIGVLGYPQHRWLYSERSLEVLLNRAGLRVVRLRHFGCAPSVLFYRTATLLARSILDCTGEKGGKASVAAVYDRRFLNRFLKQLFKAGHGSLLDAIEQFLRYRVGAFAPRIGPGTLFVAACPLNRD